METEDKDGGCALQADVDRKLEGKRLKSHSGVR